MANRRVNNIGFYNNGQIILVPYIVGDHMNLWFKFTVVAEILEETHATDILHHIGRRYCRPYDAENGWQEFDISNIQIDNIFINELGLYAISSKTIAPVARRFEFWVYDNVAPLIRRRELELELQMRDQLEPPRASLPSNKVFILMNLNCIWDYKYFVIKGERSYAERLRASMEIQHPESEVLLTIYNLPDVQTLYEHMKQNIEINHWHNFFKSPNLSEKELVNQIVNIARTYADFNESVIISAYIFD